MRLLLVAALCMTTLSICSTAKQCPANEDYDHECLAKNSGKVSTRQVFPDNANILLDSHRYSSLIGSRWTAVDGDNDKETWIEKGTVCKLDARSHKSEQGSQDNWLFSHYIPYLNSRQVMVNITYKFQSCDSSQNCEGNTIEVYRFDSEQEASAEEVTDTQNYQHKEVLEQLNTGHEELKQWSYQHPDSASGFYMGFKDTGTTARIRIKRVVVWYEMVPEYELGLVSCDCMPLPSPTETEPMTQDCSCSPGAEPVGSMTRSVSYDGEIHGEPECTFDNGLKDNSGIHTGNPGTGKDGSDKTTSKKDKDQEINSGGPTDKFELDKPYFQLGDNNYTDGSTAPIEDLSEHSLMCVTQYKPCCNVDRKGEIYYPDNTVVAMTGDSLFMSRDDEGGVSISMGEKKTPEPPTGMYCCEIPDITGQTTRICVNLVHE